jgi:ribosomal protein S18 acetylase RimI-like enzyme
MNVRGYLPGDRDALIDLWERVFPDDPPHNNPGQMIEAKSKVDGLIFVAEDRDRGTIAGAIMAGYDGHRGWLYEVAVEPNQCRKGVGTQLVKHAVRQLQAIGCVKVNLQVRTSNSEVVDFYTSVGFVVEDRISMGRLL